MAMICPLFIVVAASPSPSVADSEHDVEHASLFGATSLRFTDLSTFEKWTDVLRRYPIQQEKESCKKTTPSVCLDRFERIMQQESTTDKRRSQLVAVNTFVNQTPYESDLEKWKIPDYWATPIEFLGHSGDCEDFAIAKYFLLRKLGWTSDELRITAVINLNHGTGHAILIAYLGDTQWILDNEINEVVDSRKINRYRPLFSLNETAWWQY